MANSGYFNTGNYEGRCLQFSWTARNPDIVNNQTTIDWTLKGAGTGQVTYYYAGNFKVIIDGQTVYSYTGSRFKLLNGTIVASGTYTFTHNDDGTKSFTAYAEGGIYTYAVNCTGSATFTLDTIPRASDFTISEGTLGVAQTISVTRKSTDFTHGLTYSCGSVSTQLICAWNTAAESVSFTPPIDLAWQAPNGSRVWVSIHLQTYDSGGTPIGNTVTKGVWMTIPASVKPSCSVAVSDPTGCANKYGAYIQGQSKLAIKVTPKTAYGSAIASCLILADNNKYTVLETVTPTVQSTGNIEVYADVTDTRGRLGSTSDTINVLPYSKPVITQLKVHRCDEDGTENNRGQFAKVTYGYTIDTISGKNGMSAYIQFKKTTEAEYTSVELPEAFDVDSATFIFAADDDFAYDVQLSIADDFTQVSHKTTVSTAFTLIHYAASGRGITFGGISNEDGVHIISIPFTIDGVEVDYIVEQGEVDGWFYRKWNGGFAECWKVYYGTGIASGKNNYSGFFYSETISVPFPFTFTNLPTVTVDGGSVTYMNFVRGFGKYSDKASFVVVGMVDAGSVDVTVDIKAIGKWK